MKKIVLYITLLSIVSIFTYCSGKEQNTTLQVVNNNSELQEMEKITFGAGCFWCVEAIFERVNGVTDVVSGYMGGNIKNPTYKEVCTGNTGHAEVCQLIYNPSIISFEELLEIFWKTHDPTTLNRQGNDVGTQYRSVIFYHTDKQKELAEEYKLKLSNANIWKDPIITLIEPATEFYEAEDYHQKYFDNNSKQPYCSFVIQPKVEKFEKIFKKNLK